MRFDGLGSDSHRMRPTLALPTLLESSPRSAHLSKIVTMPHNSISWLRATKWLAARCFAHGRRAECSAGRARDEIV